MGIKNLYACIGYPEKEDEYLTRDSFNFHKHLGFKQIGYFRHCGYKFGRPYSMVWLEKVIARAELSPAPVQPYGDTYKNLHINHTDKIPYFNTGKENPWDDDTEYNHQSGRAGRFADTRRLFGSEADIVRFPAVEIICFLPFRKEKDKQINAAEGDDANKQPPAALIDIMQAAYTETKERKE